MTTKTVARVALPVPLYKSFDYLIDKAELPCKGARVKVPFRNREMIGIVEEVISDSNVAAGKLKKITQVIDYTSIFSDFLINLCQWAAEYYHHPLGEVLFAALPNLIREGKPPVMVQEPRFQLTQAGQEIDPISLKKAPKQAALLIRLAKESGLTAKQMGNLKGVLKGLLAKGWIEVCADAALSYSLKPTAALKLNPAQQTALTAIQQETGFKVFLLDGITGSGKTEVYLQAIAGILLQQKQVLVLVPEIGLTPQTIQRFRERFSVPVVALHSGLTEKERLNAWVAARTGAAKIIIGTRSAIFTPFTNLGLIVVDEEHDLSFKQQEGFRYHARDLAVMRARYENIPIVLGSATPSLETLHNAKSGRYLHLRLTERAGAAVLPEFQIFDIRKTPLEEGLSPQLLIEIKKHLAQNNQVMLFLNRRGFAPVLMCHTCGWIAMCKRCDARMTLHQFPQRLHCHHCDSQTSVFKNCQSCADAALHTIGLGTERLEQVLEKHFPGVSIGRMDRDNTQRKGALENLLEKIQTGEHKILIGTQMLAKGHHFPNVTLVGIIDADGGFFSADFRALERMGQLLLQVSGRAGRMEKPGTVIIQTHHPDHPLLHQLLKENYHAFATSLLAEREQAKLPPYNFFALFRAEAYDTRHATTFLQHIKTITGRISEGIRVLGPISAPLARRAGRYRMQLLIQAAHRPILQHFLKVLVPAIEEIPNKQQVRWSLDVDPLEMF